MLFQRRYQILPLVGDPGVAQQPVKQVLRDIIRHGVKRSGKTSIERVVDRAFRVPHAMCQAEKVLFPVRRCCADCSTQFRFGIEPIREGMLSDPLDNHSAACDFETDARLAHVVVLSSALTGEADPA